MVSPKVVLDVVEKVLEVVVVWEVVVVVVAIPSPTADKYLRGVVISYPALMRFHG